MIVAFDLSTHTGWALGDGGRPRAGSIDLKGPSEGATLARARRFFLEFFAGHPVTAIFAEAPVLPRNSSIGSRLSLFGIRAMLVEVAFERGIPLTEVAVASWRRHFIGVTSAPKGTPKSKTTLWLKNTVIDECYNRGFGAVDDDAADALGLLDYALAKTNPAYGASAAPLFRV